MSLKVVNVLLRMPQIQIFELSLQSETQQEILFDLSNPYNVNDPQNLSSGTDYTLVIKLRVFQHSVKIFFHLQIAVLIFITFSVWWGSLLSPIFKETDCQLDNFIGRLYSK